MPERLSKAAAKSNLAPETYLQHRAAIGVSARELREAQGRHQATLKKAKSDGINTKHMLMLIGLQKQEPEDVSAMFRDLQRFSAWEGKPLGTQAGLFGGDDSPMPTEKAMEEFKAADVRQAGYEAGLHGESPDACPHPAGTPHHVTWREGMKLGTDFMAGIGKSPKSKTIARGKRGKGNPEDRPAP